MEFCRNRFNRKKRAIFSKSLADFQRQIQGLVEHYGKQKKLKITDVYTLTIIIGIRVGIKIKKCLN